jgi:pimeloyl-ACP methyl ester carboxylesterase
VHALDWRGNGDSTRSADARYDTASLADDLESLVLELVSEPPQLRCAPLR